MRRYADSVEVRRDGSEQPSQFLWRGRLWKVRAVVAHWIVTAPWWPCDEAPAPDLLTEREVWRVEAGRRLPGDDDVVSGVFDLSLDWAQGRWTLVGCAD